MSSVLAWHFVGDTLRDGSPIPGDGVKLTYQSTCKLCESGLHASIIPFDALKYAPGNTLCRVLCSGRIIESSDKLVCSERTILQRMDATEMLYFYARMQAIKVIDLWSAPDVVIDYLMTGDESLMDEARGAAIGASMDAIWDPSLMAAGAAARAAARAAGLGADWGAPSVAARAAAIGAARDAARAAAWDAARAAPRDAAGDAACGEVWAAAFDVSACEFNNLVYECFGVES